MKKFIYEVVDGKVKCEAANLDIKELAAEVGILINNLYTTLARQEPIAGIVFKGMIEMLLLPDAPTWEVSDLREGESSTLIMGIKE
jgi:hypothetical protein